MRPQHPLIVARWIAVHGRPRAAMGEKFSTKEFQNLVLRAGDVPPDVLGAEVDSWIASTQ